MRHGRFAATLALLVVGVTALAHAQGPRPSELPPPPRFPGTQPPVLYAPQFAPPGQPGNFYSPEVLQPEELGGPPAPQMVGPMFRPEIVNPMIGPEPGAPCEPPPPPKLWEGSIEFGLTGSTGNSEVSNVRLGANGKRKTPVLETSLSLLYVKSAQDGREVTNRAFLEGRQEWLSPDSPWTRYVHGTGEYDEFRAFDFRTAADIGLGYAWIRNPATTFIGRFGPGFSHELGGPDDSVVPEAVLGLEVEHKLSPRQKISASTICYPDLSDAGEYRLNSKAAWELLVDPDWNLSLKLSLSDRYDSTPNWAQENDLDYSALLLWSF